MGLLPDNQDECSCGKLAIVKNEVTDDVKIVPVEEAKKIARKENWSIVTQKDHITAKDVQIHFPERLLKGY